MRSNELDQDSLVTEKHGDDQSVPVALDVEAHPRVAQDAGARKLRGDVVKRVPVRGSRRRSPCPNRLLGVGVISTEFE